MDQRPSRRRASLKEADKMLDLVPTEALLSQLGKRCAGAVFVGRLYADKSGKGGRPPKVSVRTIYPGDPSNLVPDARRALEIAVLEDSEALCIEAAEMIGASLEHEGGGEAT